MKHLQIDGKRAPYASDLDAADQFIALTFKFIHPILPKSLTEHLRGFK
jgi:hypothetical protein